MNGGWKRSKSRFGFLKHKLLNLGIPYFAFSTLYILINGLIPGTNSEFSITDIVSLGNKPIVQYWYLYALFMLFFLYVVLSKWLTNLQITVLLICTRYLCMLFSASIPLIGLAISNCVAFGLGASFQDIKILEGKKTVAVVMGIIHIGLFAGGYVLDLFSYPVVEDFLRVFGVIASVMIISCVCEIGMIQKVFLFINKYSFPIFLLHTIFTAGIRIILKKDWSRQLLCSCHFRNDFWNRYSDNWLFCCF